MSAKIRFGQLTQLERAALRELADAFEQPWRDLLAALIDALLYALAHSLLDGSLDLVPARAVLGGDGHSEECGSRRGQSEAGVCALALATLFQP